MDLFPQIEGGSANCLRYVYTCVGESATTLSDFVIVGDSKTCLIGAPRIHWHLLGENPQRGEVEPGGVLTITCSELPRRNSWH